MGRQRLARPLAGLLCSSVVLRSCLLSPAGGVAAVRPLRAQSRAGRSRAPTTPVCRRAAAVRLAPAQDQTPTAQRLSSWRDIDAGRLHLSLRGPSPAYPPTDGTTRTLARCGQLALVSGTARPPPADCFTAKHAALRCTLPANSLLQRQTGYAPELRAPVLLVADWTLFSGAAAPLLDVAAPMACSRMEL